MKPEIERQEMRAYLLGTLDGDQKSQFEERILTEPGVYEELLIAEEELIDQYVALELSSLERKQFENHFLITAERQKNLRFGKLLQDYASSQINLTPVPAKSFSVRRTPARRWAWVGVMAALLGCAGIICVRGLVNKREAASIEPQSIPRVMVVTLPPGSAGTEGSHKQVIVSPKGAEVKLELELKNSTFQNYKSELFRENKSLQISDGITIEAKGGGQRIVPFTVTGEKLSPGDYQVKLSGVSDSGANEFIDNYSFRVIE